MGSSPSKSLEDISMAEVAAFVGSLGNNFKPYEQAIRESSVTTKELASMNDDEFEKLLDSLVILNRLHRRKLASVCRKRLRTRLGGETDTSSTSSSSNISPIPHRIAISNVPPLDAHASFHTTRSFCHNDDSSVAGSVGAASAAASFAAPPAMMPGKLENMCVAQSFEALSLLVNMENQKRLLSQTNRPSGPPENKAAIVLTDVQGSTSLWEADPKAMKAALNVHDEIIRGLRADHGGYEIDTEGDAFFLAFHTAKDAITFAMNLQAALLEAEWEDDILAQPEGQKGLRVRIGIHFGPVTKRTNAVTGRLEYTGETLNRAREIEKMADGGQILTTSSTFEAAAMAAQVKKLGDDVVEVLCQVRKTPQRRPSLGAGSVHSLGSAAKRLSEGRKKRRSSIKKSFSSLGNDNDHLTASIKKGRRRRAPSRSKSMPEAEAATKMGVAPPEKNFQWSSGVKAGA